jgi:hypothetical protein
MLNDIANNLSIVDRSKVTNTVCNFYVRLNCDVLTTFFVVLYVEITSYML